MMEEQIIDFMKANSFMYDLTAEEFWNDELKEQKWEELAESIGESVYNTKRQWKILKNNFYRLDQRMSESNGHPQNGREKWEHYDDLMFLKVLKETIRKLDRKEILIKFMKENDFMHNSNSPEYRNMRARDLKWQELASILDEEVGELKRKWKNLRDGFHKEQHKLRSWAEIGGESQSKWKYYEKLRFLTKNKRKRLRSISSSDKEVFEEIYKNHSNTLASSDSCFSNEDNTSADWLNDAAPVAMEENLKFEVLSNPDDDEDLDVPEEDCSVAIDNNRKSAISLFFESMANVIDSADISIEETLHLQSRIIEVVSSCLTSFRSTSD